MNRTLNIERILPRNWQVPFRISKEIKSINIPLLTFSILYYGIIVYMAIKLNLWEDEVYSLNTSSKSLVYAYTQSFNFELQPPVYFLILTLWRFISNSIIWARLLSLIFVIIAQFLLYNFTLKASGKKIASIISIILLLNPYTLYAILEIRVYALVILLGIVLLISFYYSYYSNNCSIGNRILVIIFAILGLFTQYFIGFLLFSFGVVLIFDKKWKSLRLFLLDMIIPLTVLICFAQIIIQGINVTENSFQFYDRSLKLSLYEMVIFVFRNSIYNIIPLDFFQPDLRWIITGGCLIFLFFAINYSSLKKNFNELSPFIICTFICYAFFCLVLLCYGKYFAQKKYMTIVFVPVLFILIFFLKYLKPVFLYLGLILLIIAYVLKGYVNYNGLYKVKDLRGLGSYIENIEGSREPIFVYRNITAENLRLYYKGRNSLIPVPKDFSYNDEFGENQWIINIEFFNEFKQKVNEYDSFLVVIDNSPLRGVKESTEILLSFLESKYQIRTKKLFGGNIELFRFAKINHCCSKQ
jgi:uncharacterized membrane protein